MRKYLVIWSKQDMVVFGLDNESMIKYKLCTNFVYTCSQAWIVRSGVGDRFNERNNVHHLVS